MEKAFLFIKTRVRVEPADRSGLGKTVETLSAQTVVIKTRERVGAGVRIGDCIITSLSLVQNETLFTVITGDCRGRNQAVIVGRDEDNQLAKLKEVEFGRPAPRNFPSVKFGLAKSKAIGEALLTVDARTQVLKVEAAAMLYSTRIAGREEMQKRWRIDPNRPSGCLGGGVFDLDGCLVGMTIGRMISPSVELLQQSVMSACQKLGPEKAVENFAVFEQSLATCPRLYAVPVERVLDLVETN